MPASRQILVRLVTASGRGFRGWQICQLPLGARVWLLSIEALALALAVAMPVVQPVSSRSLLSLLALTTLALTWAEVVRRSERIRAYLTVGERRVYAAPTDIWTFAALVIAPSGWAVLVVLVLFAQEALHTARDKTNAPHRMVFTAAAAIVAQVVAGHITDLTDHTTTGTTTVLLLVVAAAAFSAVELVIMLAGMWSAAGRPPFRALLPDKDALSYNSACLALGITCGVLLLQAPLAVVVLLIPIALLQRGTLVAALHKKASSDSKTGVSNAGAWQRNAQLTLDRCRLDEKSVAVLLIDIDNFRTINSDVGHVAADRLLVGVADAVRDEVRDDDCTGRFGGDEFVVIVGDVDAETARAIGERIRASVASRFLELESGRTVRATVSIGLAHASPATLPAHVDALLDRADKALYASKHAGRDYVSVTELAA